VTEDRQTDHDIEKHVAIGVTVYASRSYSI